MTVVVLTIKAYGLKSEKKTSSYQLGSRFQSQGALRGHHLLWVNSNQFD